MVSVECLPCAQTQQTYSYSLAFLPLQRRICVPFKPRILGVSDRELLLYMAWFFFPFHCKALSFGPGLSPVVIVLRGGLNVRSSDGSALFVHLRICPLSVRPSIQEMRICVLTESWAFARFCGYSCDLDKTLSHVEFTFL